MTGQQLLCMATCECTRVLSDRSWLRSGTARAAGASCWDRAGVSNGRAGAAGAAVL